MRVLTFTLALGYAAIALAQSPDRTYDSNWAGSRNADLGSDVSALDAETPRFDDPSVSAPIPTTQQPTERPAPTMVPQPPVVTSAPQRQTDPTPTPEVPPGQWVYTQQYGWIYAPYAQAYTYVPEDTSTAQMYAWRAGLGWAWLFSPWIFSIGPRPYWGAAGPRPYVWYSRPWFRPRVVNPGYGSRVGPYHSVGPGPFHARPHPRAIGPRRWR